MIVEVRTAEDPRLRDFTDLTDVALRRVREPEEGLFLAEGSTVVHRAVAAGYAPRGFLLARRWLDGLADVLTAWPDVPVFVADEEVLEAVTGYRVHRGALASMSRRPLPPLDEVLAGARRLVVLEDLVDHTNVGAVFRSVAALGADAVVVAPRCADPLYRRSVRVSMGTVFAVPWARSVDWPGDLDVLRRAGFVVTALALADDAVPLDEFADNAPDRVALVLGAEGDGLSARAVGACDVVVRIPMSGGVDSLNVAAASAVALWALR